MGKSWSNFYRQFNKYCFVWISLYCFVSFTRSTRGRELKIPYSLSCRSLFFFVFENNERQMETWQKNADNEVLVATLFVIDFILYLSILNNMHCLCKNMKTQNKRRCSSGVPQWPQFLSCFISVVNYSVLCLYQSIKYI